MILHLKSTSFNADIVVGRLTRFLSNWKFEAKRLTIRSTDELLASSFCRRVAYVVACVLSNARLIPQGSTPALYDPSTNQREPIMLVMSVLS